MKLLTRYLWKNVAFSILITWFSLVMLDAFFAFMSELGDTNPDTHYGTLQAALYTVYTSARRFYDYFPTATLIGALLGLGNLAASSELIAMRAAGLSIMRIVGMTLQMGLLLAVIAFGLGEWIAPRAETLAQNYKLRMLERPLSVDAQGVWLKNNNTIIHIDKLWATRQLEGITLYQLDMDKGAISHIEHAEKADFANQVWTLHKVERERFTPERIELENVDSAPSRDIPDPATLSVAALQPQQLAAAELAKYIEHQQANELDSARFELAYWTHYTTPLSALVMLIIAAPFVFGSQRMGGTGQRVFVGILLGIGFFLLNRTIGSVSLVYGLPPLLAATLPLGIFLLLGLGLLQRVR